MRKQLREITDKEEIKDLFRNTDVIRLGISDEKQPYVVPVSFGFDWSDEQPTFYFHGAREGKKFELLTKNPFVCVEGDNFYRYKKTAASVTCLYESFIANGGEAERGLKKILEHCGYAETAVPEKCAANTAVFEIAVEQISGKRRDTHSRIFRHKIPDVYRASHREFLPHNLSLAHYTLQAGQVRFFILLFYLFVLQYLKNYRNPRGRVRCLFRRKTRA